MTDDELRRILNDSKGFGWPILLTVILGAGFWGALLWKLFY